MGLPDEQAMDNVKCFAVARMLAGLLPAVALILALATLLGCVVVQDAPVRQGAGHTARSVAAITTVVGSSDETL